MKKLTITILIILSWINLSSQEIEIGITLLETKSYIEAKRTIKRFDKANIGKDYFVNIIPEADELLRYAIELRTPEYNTMTFQELKLYYLEPNQLFNYYIEVDESDKDEYYEIFGIKKMCIKEKQIENIELYLD